MFCSKCGNPLPDETEESNQTAYADGQTPVASTSLYANVAEKTIAEHGTLGFPSISEGFVTTEFHFTPAS